GGLEVLTDPAWLEALVSLPKRAVAAAAVVTDPAVGPVGVSTQVSLQDRRSDRAAESAVTAGAVWLALATAAWHWGAGSVMLPATLALAALAVSVRLLRRRTA